MAQELGISEKDSDFQNPFKVDHAEVRLWGPVAMSALPPLGHGRPGPAGAGSPRVECEGFVLEPRHSWIPFLLL